MYMEGRLQDQIDWYGRNARKNEINQQRFLVMTIVLEFVGVLGAVLRITNVVNFDALGIIAAITAGAASWAQTRQYGQLGRAYSIAAHELSIIKAECAFVDAERWPRFVDEAEEAISREHTLWRASRGVLPHRPRPLA